MKKGLAKVTAIGLCVSMLISLAGCSEQTEYDKAAYTEQSKYVAQFDKNDVNLSNANMSSHTPAGQMMTFASEITKDIHLRRRRRLL